MTTENQPTEANSNLEPVPSKESTIVLGHYDKRIARQKSRVQIEFFYAISGILVKGFHVPGRRLGLVQYVNFALKHNTNIVIGESPNFAINFKNVLISKGEMAKPNNATVKQVSKFEIELKWDKKLARNAKPTDRMCWLHYNATHNYSYIITSEELRCSGKENAINLPIVYQEDIHYWMFFVSEDGRMRSDSVYIGRLGEFS